MVYKILIFLLSAFLLTWSKENSGMEKLEQIRQRGDYGAWIADVISFSGTPIKIEFKDKYQKKMFVTSKIFVDKSIFDDLLEKIVFGDADFSNLEFEEWTFTNGDDLTVKYNQVDIKKFAEKRAFKKNFEVENANEESQKKALESKIRDEKLKSKSNKLKKEKSIEELKKELELAKAESKSIEEKNDSDRELDSLKKMKEKVDSENALERTKAWEEKLRKDSAEKQLEFKQFESKRKAVIQKYLKEKSIVLIQGEKYKNKYASVTLNSYYVSTNEVTQSEYEKVIGENPLKKEIEPGPNRPSEFAEIEKMIDPHKPVTYVSWSDANKFCREIGGRLPSEMEWEYACSEGKSTLYFWGENRDWKAEKYFHDRECVPYYSDCIFPVRQKEPNSFGLYDMVDNADEWVAGTVIENSDSLHVLRGGISYGCKERTGGILWNSTLVRGDFGFRCVFDP